MATYPMFYAANMTEQQRARYYAELSLVQKDEVLGVLLAVFLGTFGAHHFYMRRTGLGILYCFLSVTGFSTIAGFVEAFFMPARIRRYNANQAAAIANHLGIYNYPGRQPVSATSGSTLEPPAPVYTPVFGVAVAPTADLTATAPQTCPTCKALVSAGVNYCAICGTPLKAISPVNV